MKTSMIKITILTMATMLLGTGATTSSSEVEEHRCLSNCASKLTSEGTIDWGDYCGIQEEDMASGLVEACFAEIGPENILGLHLFGYFLNIPMGLFDGMVELKELFIDGYLDSLEAGLFDDLASLEKLSIAHNWNTANDLHFDTLPDGLFRGLSSVTYLSLRDNNLRVIADGVFDDMVALEELKLDENEIVELPSGIFSKLSSLEDLDVSDNYLTCYPVSYAYLIKADEGVSECEGGEENASG